MKRGQRLARRMYQLRESGLSPKRARQEFAREMQTATPLLSDRFLTSLSWRQLRMVVLKRDGARCACCGAMPEKGNRVRVNVDHIKPRKTHPELALDPNNLQVLCTTCNIGKGNWDETDWRSV